MSIDTHEEPWLREALAGLVSHEPPLDTSVVMDVRRGEVARETIKRRRTAALAIAAVAVVAVPAGLVLRSAVTGPKGTPAATTAPKIAGVSQAWLDAITPAVLDTDAYVVDWPASTLAGTTSTGFLLDLTLVPVQLTLSGDSRTVTQVPVTETSRITLRWMPGSTGPGPDLVRCPKAACPEYGPTQIVGGPLDTGATAGPAAAFPEGTVILDRTDPNGLLEVVSYPAVATPGHAATDGASSRPVLRNGYLAYMFLTTIGSPVTGPPGPAPSPSIAIEQRARVEPVLTRMGVVVTDASLQSINWGDGRTQVTYTARPASDPEGRTITEDLVIGSFPPVSSDSAFPSGSFLESCTPATCSDIGMTSYDCIQGAVCPAEEFATVRKGHPSLPEGAAILLLRYPDGTAVEGVATPPECTSCTTSAYSVQAFLGDSQLRTVLRAVGDAPQRATPAPSVTPVTSTQTAAQIAEALKRPCTAADVTLSLAFVDPIEGENAVGVVAHNSSPRPCGLDGAPTVTLMAGAPLRATYVVGEFPGWPAALTSGPFLLTPGSDASIIVGQRRCGGAPGKRVTSMSVQLPGDHSATALPIRTVGSDLRQCNDLGAGADEVYVEAFSPGGMN